MYSILKKELKHYFDHPTAYILIVVFLMINSFFYFRIALLQGVADLRPMFDLLPWLLLFFAPAITMRLLAEEKQTGTLELTLAQPIKPWVVLAGKVLGGFVFLASVLLLTLLIPIFLSGAGQFDWGQVIAQYIAVLLLALSFVSIGICMSSVSKNQVVAFISSLALGFFFIIAGSEVVTVGLRGVVQMVVGRLSVFEHYQNMTRGVIDLRDVIYFFTFIFSFLSVSYVWLVRTMVKKSSRSFRQLKLGVIALIAISILINLLGSSLLGRIDLTKGDLYTLSSATKQLLRGVEDIVTIKVFASENLPTQFSTIERDTQDIVRDFKRLSRGNVNVEFITIKDNSDSHAQEAARFGIIPVQFNVLKKQEFTLQQGYFGLVVVFADEHEVIPFIEQTSYLEYQLASFIRRLIAVDQARVAFLTGHGEKGSLRELATFRSELVKQYEVIDFAINAEGGGERLGPEIDTLVIAGPTEPFTDFEKQEIRNYIKQGGKVFFMIDTVLVNPQVMQVSINENSLADFVEEYGVRVNSDIAFDVRANESVTFGGGFINYILPYPFWLKAVAGKENPITGDVQSIVFPWSSSLELVGKMLDKSLVHVLFTTTEFANSQTQQFNLAPNQKFSVAQEDLSELLMAVAVELDKGDGSVDSEQSIVEPGRLVVIGDSEFLTEQFVRNQTNGSNFIFGLNAVDWLAQDELLISIRSKNRQPAPLVFETENGSNTVRYINLIGVPALVVLYGAFRLIIRRRKSLREYY